MGAKQEAGWVAGAAVRRVDVPVVLPRAKRRTMEQRRFP